MKKNMGNVDRIIRVVVAIAIIIMYFTNTISGTLGIILLALAGIFLITSVAGFCPLYLIWRKGTHAANSTTTR